jgi:hypothetical protein
MNLSVSPDWDARWCYLLVLLCGLISARSQLYKRFVEAKISGVWLVPNTWFIFGIYLVFPLALFWLMDRMSALNDTSLFAALLVGLAYPAILAGGIGGLKAPSGVEGALKPLQAFTDSVITSVTKITARNNKKFEDFVVSRMRTTPAIFDDVLATAKSSPIDVPALEKQLTELDQVGIADTSVLLEKKARIIYLYLSGAPDFVETLTGNKELMKGRRWYSPIFRTKIVVGVMIFLFVVLLGLGIYIVTRPSLAVTYYGWRISKMNNSERDRFRARENLRQFLRDPKLGEQTYQYLARAVRLPGLPVERVDMILQLLLQARDRQDHPKLICAELIDDLRVDSVDARSRVHQTLLFLASKRDPQFKQNQKELDGWNPSKGDAVASLEEWIGRWRTFFCEPLATPAPSPTPGS